MRPKTNPTDPLAALAEQVVEHRPGAVRGFLITLAPYVLRVVRQVLGRDHPDMEDLVQEALLGALDALPRFRGECTTLHFVQRIALLTALNSRRRFALREQLVPRAHDADADGVAAQGACPAEALDAARRRAVFGALLDELPAAQAEAPAMHCVLGYTVAETAAAVGAPVNTVRGRIVAAKAALRERLALDPIAQELFRGVS
ncbi:MAG: RNA polymerase sigma factor [Polyangiaceae bacterium]|nr:RNA polymerase sigma factor [Polyangiaceae bacterium]